MNAHDRARSTSMSGTAASIHCRKVTLTPAFSNAPRAIAFGGVPTGVPIPPTFAATGIDRAMPVRALPSGRAMMTGIITANIVAVVAVFDMNILMIAVISMTPITVRRGLPMKGLRRTADRARSSLYLAAPSATMKPPRNRMMTGLASAPKNFVYAGAPSPTLSSAWSEMNRTSRKMTRTAVPASGTASVTHSRIAARKIPNMRVPDTSRPGS